MPCPELPYHLKISSLPYWQSCWICFSGCPLTKLTQHVSILPVQILSWHDNTSSSECLPRLEVHSVCNCRNFPFLVWFVFCWSAGDPALQLLHMLHGWSHYVCKSPYNVAWTPTSSVLKVGSYCNLVPEYVQFNTLLQAKCMQSDLICA